MAAASPEFDFSAPPFDLLTTEQARDLGARVGVESQPRGTRILEAGQGSDTVYVIVKGHVAAIDEQNGERRTFAEYGSGDLFGALASITGSARHSYEAVEDVLLWTVPAEAFRRSVESNGRFAAYFLDSLSRKSALIQAQLAGPGSDVGELMLTLVGDATLSEAVVVPDSCALADATRRMRDRHVDCVFVELSQGLGIATRTDLLEALTLAGRSPGDPVGEIARHPVIGCAADEPLFQALVQMTRKGIERIAVFAGDRLVGTLGMAEVLSHYSSHSHVIGLRIARAVTPEQLAEAAGGMTRLVRTLFATGARMRPLADLVNALNTRILGKLFRFTFDPALQGRCCLLVLGSEGRGEQILKTDQDNALITDLSLPDGDVADPSRRLSAALTALGYPPCPGGVMLSNAQWRGSTATWSERITQLAHQMTPASVIRAAIIADADPVAGNRELFEPFSAALRQLGRNSVWIHHFVAQAIEFHTPLTLFGSLPGGLAAVDIKKGGIFPIVHGLRTLALAHGIPATNSFERAELLMAAGELSESLGRDLQQALAEMLRVRLGEQLAALRDGNTPDDRIRIGRLERMDRDLLRDALRVVKDFQAALSAKFHHGI
jgi:CBS domain-containing protein